MIIRPRLGSCFLSSSSRAWARIECRFLWTLLPEFSDQGQELCVCAGDFPLSSLGSGLASFWVLLWLVWRGFLWAGVAAVHLGKIQCRFFCFPPRDLAVSVSYWGPVLASLFGPRPLEGLLWSPRILCHFRHCFASLCVGRGSTSCDLPAAYPLRSLAGQEAFFCVSLRTVLQRLQRALLSHENGRGRREPEVHVGWHDL